MLIVSFGGSQGAKCLNDLMPEIMQRHLQSDMDIRHIHAYGKFGRNTVPDELQARGIADDPRLRVTEYIHDMDICLAAADLVISRAGASTLCELEAIGRASILIPYPTAAENHQYHNAMALVNRGAARCIEEKDLTDGAKPLVEEVARLLSPEGEPIAEARRENIRRFAVPDSNKLIYNDLLKLVADKKKS